MWGRILLLALLLLGAWVVWTLQVGGVFRTLTPHFAGSCRAVPGLPGPEDITIHPVTGVAYISSCDRAALERGKAPHGALYALPLDRPSATPRNLTPEAGPDFCPHGISLWVDAAGRDRLFVIHHEGGRHGITAYDLEDGRLEPREEYSDPSLVSPNDLVAVARDRFYVTNDHHFPSGALRMLEEWLRLPLANVVYFDGAGFREAASGISMANGIQASRDGSRVYVASSLGRELREYDRDAASGALTLTETVSLGTVPDNIERDADDGLWIGAHPKVLALVAYRSGRADSAPSQVLHLSREAGTWRVDEVYLGSGEELSASSVAAVRDRRLLVGAIFGQHLLDCRLP